MCNFCPPLLGDQSAAQQALVGTINTSMQAVQQAQTDLEEVEELPPLGDDMVRKCIHVTSHLLSCIHYRYFILKVNFMRIL